MFRQALRTTSRQRHALNKATSTATRALCTTPRYMSSVLPTVSPPVSSALPSDSFQLLAEASKAGDAEDALFDQQVKDVQAWWQSPRYEGIKRPYTAEDVVLRRGTLQQTYPSSLMARKLFNLFEERAKEGKPVHTSRQTTILGVSMKIAGQGHRGKKGEPD